MPGWLRNARAAVAAAVALCVVAAAWHVAHVVRADHRALRHASGSLTARDFAPADDYGLTHIVTGARRVLPPDALFTIVVGNAPPPNALAAQAIFSIVPDGLLPRRFTTDLHAARWVITYHESSEAVGVRIGREIGLGSDSNVIEVNR